MVEKEKVLMLIDGMALLYRGHFALIKSPRLTSGGMNTSAIFVFTNSVFDLLKRKRPTHIAVALDTPEPTHRHTLYKEYKAHRDVIPEDIVTAIKYLHRLCDALNIPLLTFVSRHQDLFHPVIIDVRKAKGP